MDVAGQVQFSHRPPEVYVYLARQVLAHAVEPREDDVINTDATILTRYRTKIGPFTAVTTEEVSLEPGRSITWRHVDGPLTGSVERFTITVRTGGATVVDYEGSVRARNSFFRGPFEWAVARLTRRISLGSLQDAKLALEGKQVGRDKGRPIDGGDADFPG